MPYYVKLRGEVVGPGSDADLRHLASIGELDGCLIGRSPGGPWTPAERVKGLFSTQPALDGPDLPTLPEDVVGVHKARLGTWRYYHLRRAATQAVLAIVGAVGGDPAP